MKEILNHFVDVPCGFAKQTSINFRKAFDLSDTFIDLSYFRNVAKIFPKKSKKFRKGFAAAQRFTGILLSIGVECIRLSQKHQNVVDLSFS